MIHVALAGANSLGGPGVLTYLKFVIDPIGFSTTPVLYPANALFNEIYPSINVNGSVSISVLSTITVSPNTATIVDGDQLQFNISGTTTPPVTWAVTNPTVASIDATGKLTALASGVTQVRATDNLGRTDITDIITICDLYLNAPTQSVFYTQPVAVAIQPDRRLTGLGIYGYELILTFDPAKVFVTGVSTAGTATASWGTPVYNASIPGQVVVVHAGASPLSGTLPLVKILFQSLVSANGSTTTLTISKILFNEGDPCALVRAGSLVVTGVGDTPLPALDLEQNIPNPFNPMTAIAYRVATGGAVTLRVYGSDGSLVRTLVDEVQSGGSFNRVEWDGTDDSGHRVASGVYYYRLQNGGHELTRKMLLLK
jgi:hypothetical protein